MTDNLRLRNYPSSLVRLACSKCVRRGQYRRATLIEKYGEDIPLPTLLTAIAQCTGGVTSGQWSNCGAYYVDLAVE